MSAHSALLHSLEEMEQNPLDSDLLDAVLVKLRSTSLQTAVDTMPKKAASKLWSSTRTVVEALVNEEDFHDQLQSFQGVEASELTVKAKSRVELLCFVIKLLKSFMRDEMRPLPEAAMAVLAAVHNHLFEFSGQETEELVEETVTACEMSIIQARPGHELVATLTLPFLALNSLQPSASEGDIKRLWAVRKAFYLLDFDDESIDSLKELLLRCFISPLHLKTREGRRFLSFVLQLNVGLTKDVHHTIRNQFPATKALLDIYGQVYFRAWSDAETIGEAGVLGTVPRSTLESICIEDLLHRGIHAASSSTFEGCRSILDVFVAHKKETDVEEALYRLYSPILWRSLEAPNPIVRKNAAVLLFDVFPLRDPSATRAEFDEFQKEQLTKVRNLLLDNTPAVRIVAVQGSGKLLGLYWEIIPAECRGDILKLLFQDLIRDAKSPQVRTAVLKAVDFILSEAHGAHDVLVGLLPSLGILINDKTEGVRVALLRLLRRVDRLRNIDFYDIVPVEKLLARLVLDSKKSTASVLICRLLLSSFYPQKEATSIQLTRMVQALYRHPAATLVFCRYLHRVVSTPAVCKLLLLLRRALSVALKHSGIEGEEESEEEDEEAESTASKKRGKKGRKPKKRSRAEQEETTQERVLVATNGPFMLSIIQACVTLWSSVDKKLRRGGNQVAHDKLIASFGEGNMEALTKGLRAALKAGRKSENASVWDEIEAGLLSLSSFLPSSEAGGAVKVAWKKLFSHSDTLHSRIEAFNEAMGEDGGEAIAEEWLHVGHHVTGKVNVAEVRDVVLALWRWGQREELLRTVAASLEGKDARKHSFSPMFACWVMLVLLQEAASTDSPDAAEDLRQLLPASFGDPSILREALFGSIPEIRNASIVDKIWEALLRHGKRLETIGKEARQRVLETADVQGVRLASFALAVLARAGLLLGEQPKEDAEDDEDMESKAPHENEAGTPPYSHSAFLKVLFEWVVVRAVPLYAGVHPALAASAEGSGADPSSIVSAADMLVAAAALSGIQAVLSAVAQSQSIYGAPDGELLLLLSMFRLQGAVGEGCLMPLETPALLDKLPGPLNNTLVEGAGSLNIPEGSSVVLRESLRLWSRGGLGDDSMADLVGHLATAEGVEGNEETWNQCLSLLDHTRESLAYSICHAACDALQLTARLPGQTTRRVAEAFSFQARFVFDLLFSSLRCVLPAASRSNGLANGLKTLVLRVLNQLGQAGKPRGTVGADLTTSNIVDSSLSQVAALLKAEVPEWSWPEEEVKESEGSGITLKDLGLGRIASELPPFTAAVLCSLLRNYDAAVLEAAGSRLKHSPSLIWLAVVSASLDFLRTHRAAVQTLSQGLRDAIAAAGDVSAECQEQQEVVLQQLKEVVPFQEEASENIPLAAGKQSVEEVGQQRRSSAGQMQASAAL